LTTTLPLDSGSPARDPAIADAVRPDAGATASGARVAWIGAAAVGLLAAVVTLWDLDISGYANTYYSAAAQAASQSWSAMFFGAIDAAGFITVDKPPASLWAMGISVRILGLSPFAVLLPEALAGIGTVLLLYDAARRQFGVVAAVIAGVALAVTPVAALVFRYNNPDALLVLLLVASAWALVRGLADDRFRWLVLAGVLVGLGFLTKYLQAYLVLPGFALTYLVAGRGGVRRRLAGLVLAGASVLVASAWWVAIVELVPAASRPYVGGSTGNSVLDLVFGYDGLGRIFGQGGPGGRPAIGGPGVPGGFPGPAGGGGGGAFGGDPGWLRMLNAQWGSQIGWLLPSAAAGLVAGLWARASAPRTDARRAGFLLWGSWAIVHVLVFSLMSGIAHPYYSAAIAPAAAALTGAGLVELWRLRRRLPWAGLAIGGILVVTAGWAWVLLDGVPSYLPGLGVAVICLAVAAAIVLALPPGLDACSRDIARGAMAVGLVAILAGPAAWTAATMTRAISGGDPAAGPAGAAIGGFGGPGRPAGFTGDAAGMDQVLVDYLVANRGTASWLVAVSSASQAGPLQLASGVPVMAMGGFMGSDPAPTVEELQADVRGGRLRYVLLDGRGGGPGGFFGGDGQGSVASSRNAWVESACRPVETVGNGALYDCAGAG
jgi:4-amino-4-deoxy-L-arabinose transferase-like glycosyltransferase